MSKESTGRIPGYDYLRVLAMFMVMMLHFLSHTDSLMRVGASGGAVRFAGNFLESLCICAVNCFVLITGYFQIKRGFKAGKLIKLLLQVLFYSCGIPVVLLLFGVPVQGTDLWSVFTYILPISTEHYWFFTAYAVLYILSPVLNKGAQHLLKRQFQTVLLILLLFLCVLPSISPVQLQADRYGYDAVWFCFVYLIGAYFSMYGIPVIGTGKKGLVLYLGASLGTLAATVLLYRINERTGGFAYYATVPLHYNAVLVLLSAVGLFSFFGSFFAGKGAAGDEKGLLPEAEKKDAGIFGRFLMRLAPLTFGVYLIHHHIDLRDRWTDLTSLVFGAPSASAPVFVLQTIVKVLAAYALCLLIERLRQLLFAAIGKLPVFGEISGWLQKIDS